MNRLLIAFLLVMSSLVSHAAKDFQYSNELESKLETRIRGLVKTVDPYALVFVNVEFNEEEIQGTLPGTFLELNNFQQQLTDSGVLPEAIKDLKVIILTRETDLPTWVPEQITDMLGLDENQVEIQIQQMGAKTLSLIEQNRQNPNIDFTITKLAQRFQQWQKSTGLYMVMGFLGVFILALFTLMIVSFRAQSTLKNELRALGLAFQAAQSQNQSEVNFAKEEAEQAQDVELDLQPNSGEIQLAAEQSLALLSDCYWCEQDEYAAYLWQNISTPVREKLLQIWPNAAEYVSSIAFMKPKNLGFEFHPAYLAPINIENLSQQDLYTWLLKNPGAWAQLSPLRQAHLPIPLKDRIKFMKAGGQQKVDFVAPKTVSEPRKLASLKTQVNLTLEDENYLLQQPELIQMDDRSQFPTLIWFSQLETNDQQEILGGISARDLASAWVGPEEVLNKIAACLPEKKRRLLEEYSETVQPSRKSPVFRYLFTESIRRDEDAA